MRERGERREKNQNLNKAAKIFTLKMKLCSSVAFLLWVTKTMGVYIGHPLYETTIKPNIFAKLRDKEVIHQNEVGLH